MEPGRGKASPGVRAAATRSAPRPVPRAVGQQLLTLMQRVGSGLPSGSQVASRSPSAALAEQNQVATLPVRLLRDEAVAARNNVHAEDGFQMKVDAYGFAPEELVVQVDGQCLVVTGQRQLEGCSPDGAGYRVAQRVHRQMQLPPDLDPASMTCSMTPSGQLYVRGPCQALSPPEAQRGPCPRVRGRGPKKGQPTLTQ